METGIGHTIIVSLGGTKDSRFIPLEVEVMVEMLSTGNYFSRDGRMENAGFLAVLRAKNITIVVSTQSGVLCDYSMYLGLGQDPKKFDVIISDISPTKTGNKVTDQFHFYNIANEILEFSKKGLKSNGKIVIKVFIGLGFDAFNKKSKEMFKKTKYFKPKSSRPESVETYLIASTIRL